MGICDVLCCTVHVCMCGRLHTDRFFVLRSILMFGLGVVRSRAWKYSWAVEGEGEWGAGWCSSAGNDLGMRGEAGDEGKKWCLDR